VDADDGYGGDGRGSFVPGTRGEWILSDTYNIRGFQHVFLFHRPTRLFVPLAKLRCTRPNDEYEGLGRQMYVCDGHRPQPDGRPAPSRPAAG
jgi:hypothetical protein